MPGMAHKNENNDILFDHKGQNLPFFFVSFLTMINIEYEISVLFLHSHPDSALLQHCNVPPDGLQVVEAQTGHKIRDSFGQNCKTD